MAADATADHVPLVMTPLMQAPGDVSGVQAMKALRECQHHPLEVLEGGQPDTKVRFKQHVGKLYGVVQRLMGPDQAMPRTLMKGKDHVDPCIEHHKEIVESKHNKRMIDRVLTRRDTHDVETMSQLIRLTEIYRRINGSRFVKRWLAETRKVDDEELDAFATPKLAQLYYVAFPCMLFAVCFVFQSFMLHLATHFYVYYMLERDHDFGDADGHARLFDLVGNTVGSAKGNKEEGAIVEGRIEIPLALLDASGAIPLMMMSITYLYAALRGNFNIGLWNKTFIVGSCMAILKGVFDVVTIMPDSIGWASCKERLGTDGIAEFRHMKFTRDWDDAIFKLLALETMGGQGGRRVRYCADMMISGHTYFAALFSLSAYKQTYYSGSGKLAARLVGLLSCVCICTELVLVAAARFHYTVDMLAALVLVVLLFDSSYIEQLASDWSEGFRWRDPKEFQAKMSPVLNLYMRLSNRQTSSRVASGQYDSLIAPPGRDVAKSIVPSRAIGLLNSRVISGTPPWSWQHLGEPVKEALDDEFDHVDEEMGEPHEGGSVAGSVETLSPTSSPSPRKGCTVS